MKERDCEFTDVFDVEHPPNVVGGEKPCLAPVVVIGELVHCLYERTPISGLPQLLLVEGNVVLVEPLEDFAKGGIGCVGEQANDELVAVDLLLVFVPQVLEGRISEIGALLTVQVKPTFE